MRSGEITALRDGQVTVPFLCNCSFPVDAELGRIFFSGLVFHAFLKRSALGEKNVRRLLACPLFTISYYLYYLDPPASGLCQRVPARGLRFNNCVRLAMAFEDLHCTPCR